MNDVVYVIRGFLGGRKQAEEQFTVEGHARRRAAYLGAVYDSVVIGEIPANARAPRKAHCSTPPESLVMRHKSG